MKQVRTILRMQVPRIDKHHALHDKDWFFRWDSTPLSPGMHIYTGESGNLGLSLKSWGTTVHIASRLIMCNCSVLLTSLPDDPTSKQLDKIMHTLQLEGWSYELQDVLDDA